MQVIDLATTKALLGITSSDSDAAITAAIPYIDAAVKTITGNRYNVQVAGSVTSGSQYVEVWSFRTDARGYYIRYDDQRFADTLGEFVQVGQLIEGEGIPSGAYIEEVYYNAPSVTVSSTDKAVPTIKLSANATATNESAQLFLGINISYRPTIAKGIQWHINQLNTTITDNSWQSRSMGPVSVTKGSSADRIDGKSGMPFWFVRAFPRYMSGH